MAQSYQFIYGGNTGETPESIKRKREIAAVLMGKSGGFRPVRSWQEGLGSGLSSLGQGIAARITNNRADEAEAAGQASAESDFAPLARGFGGLGSGSTAPTDVPASYTSGNSTVPTSYFDAARASESGGNPNAKNPNSSASGLYQFTDGTWADVAKRHPELGLMPDGRSDPQQQEKAMRAFTSDNAGILQSKGVPITGGSLYAAHFLGSGAAPTVWNAPDNALVSSLVDPGVVAANPQLRGMTAADFRAWASQKGGGNAPVQLASAQPTVNESVVQASPEMALGTPPGSGPSIASRFPPDLSTNLPKIDPATGMTVDQEDLQTAQPVAAQGAPMPLARPAMAPAPQPMAPPQASPLHSNQAQSAGDFARAQAQAIASGNPTQPIAANGPQAAAQRPQAWMPFNKTPATPTPVSAAPMGAPAPTGAPQAAPMQGMQPPDQYQAALDTIRNPFASPGMKQVAMAVVKQRMDQQDPAHQLDTEYKRAQIDNLRNPQVKPTDDQRELVEINEQRKAAGMPSMRLDEWLTSKGKAGATVINNNPESSMFAGLPKDVRTELFTRRGEAQDAADLVNVTNQGLQLLDAGTITGAGSSGRIAALKWAQTIGIPVPEDAAAAVNNTEAYRAIMAKAVGKVIKNFGSGTGLSDADRQYAERLAGGDTSLNEAAIRRILAAGTTQAQKTIKRYDDMRGSVLQGNLDALLNVQDPKPYTPPAPRATNPNTGEVLELKDGKWTPVQP